MPQNKQEAQSIPRGELRDRIEHIHQVMSAHELMDRAWRLVVSLRGMDGVGRSISNAMLELRNSAYRQLDSMSGAPVDGGSEP